MRKAVLGLLFLLGFLVTNSLALADATITFACSAAVENASATVKVSEANPLGGCLGVSTHDCGTVECGLLSLTGQKTFKRTCVTPGRVACFLYQIVVVSPDPHGCAGGIAAGSVTCPGDRYPKLTVR